MPIPDPIPDTISVTFSGGGTVALPLVSDDFGVYVWTDNIGSIAYEVNVDQGLNKTIIYAYRIVGGGHYFWWDGTPHFAEGPVDNESEDGISWGGTATVVYGAAPSKPTNPTPVDEASDVTLDATTVTWEDGGGATSYNVYYGTLSGFLTLLESGVTDLEYTLVSGNWPKYNNIFYWRIDAVNEYGTTQGDEWYFSTIKFYPPLPTGVTLDEDGDPAGDPSGENNIFTVRRLVAAANNRIWFEDI